ncbi:MAG: hypothetical protein CK538_04015 [Opitutia bacterium]|nr:MAG: hypothetical protein CK538_04015 [Opitutae bacterium]
MTKKQESGATPRQYDAAFKDEAGRMWLTSGQSAEVTARALVKFSAESPPIPREDCHLMDDKQAGLFFTRNVPE